MNRSLIIAAWLLGLAAIAWSCSSRQGATHASTPCGLDVAAHAVAPGGTVHLPAGESV